MGARRNNEGGWDLTFSDGETYVGAPEDIARESFPEDFPDPLAEAEQQWYESHTPPQAGPPPMEPVAQPDPGQDAHDAYARIRAGALPPQQQMEQEQAQDPSLLGQAGLAPGDSVSSSESFRGTLPYGEAETADPLDVPDFSDEMREREVLAHKAEGDYIEQNNNLKAIQEDKERLEGKREGQALETMKRAQEIHDDAREEADRREAELEEALSNVSRMDMNKVWKDSDATVHFAGYLAAGIAGFLNPTGKNSVIEQMQGLADRSAREQAANIKLEMQQVEGMERSLSRYRDDAESDEELYLKTRAMLEQSMVDQITAKKEQFSSIITLGKLGVLHDAAAGRVIDTKVEHKQAAHSNAVKQQQQKDLNAHKRANRSLQRRNANRAHESKMERYIVEDERYADSVERDRAKVEWDRDQVEWNKTLQLDKQKDLNAHKTADRDLRREGMEGKLAESKRNERRAAAAQELELGPIMIDPQATTPEGDHVRVNVDPRVWKDFDGGSKKELRTKLSANHDVAESVKILHDEVAKWGAVYGGPGATWDISPDSEAYVAIDKARNNVMKYVAFATGGKTLAKHELKIFTTGLGPMKTWLKGGGRTSHTQGYMDALQQSNKRLWRQVGATYPQKTEVSPARDTSPEWKEGSLDLSPPQMVPAKYDMVERPYYGDPQQFILTDAADAQESNLAKDIEMLEATVDDVINSQDNDADGYLAGQVDEQYKVVLGKYRSGEYSSDSADATAEKVESTLQRLSGPSRPQGPWPMGQKNPVEDMKSYSAKSDGVKAALDAINGDSELAHGKVTPGTAMMGPRGREVNYTIEEFNEARKLMSLPPTMGTKR